jgi:hypothetical protein
MINEKTVFRTLINGKRVYKFATEDKPFFPYTMKIINRFSVYQVLQKREKGLCPVAN